MKNNKALGQHWLKDRAILDAIADLAALGPTTSPAGQPDPTSAQPPLTPATCLEIGPGLGTLTSSLLKRFQRVIAVEYDQRLAANLPQSFPGTSLEVVQADFLQCDLSTMPTPYVVAGNIPYYITSPIIAKLLVAQPQPARIVLLIQKEVAERIVAQPGRHTYLSLSVQNRATATLEFLVPKAYFTPPPKVDSAVITLTPRPRPLISEAALALAKQGFSNPRKKLLKNLPYDSGTLTPLFARWRISLGARPADLTHQDWQNLARSLT